MSFLSLLSHVKSLENLFHEAIGTDINHLYNIALKTDCVNHTAHKKTNARDCLHVELVLVIVVISLFYCL